MIKEDGLYLSDIYDSILRIEDYVKDGHERFMNTPMIQDAVMRNLEVIGEATKRLSDGLKQENPDIPWKQMAGLRDVLIHGYRKVVFLGGTSINTDFPGSGNVTSRAPVS